MRTVIITGANSGLGLETAKKIANASKEYRVILACRNIVKAKKAREEIISESGNENIITMELNTASLESVRRFVAEYNKFNFGSVYALLCNAGISGTNSGLTEDGFDIVFETNHLGHFLLTNLLLPYMEEDGLIFSTSSDMHDSPMEKMEWKGTDALAYPLASIAEKSIRYSYSKLCNLYFVYELADQLKQKRSDIKVNAFNPGLMKTNLMPLSKKMISFVKMSMPERYGDLKKSSTAYAQLVTEDGLVKDTGLYYDRSIQAKKSSGLSYNKENARELWQKSIEYVGLK